MEAQFEEMLLLIKCRDVKLKWQASEQLTARRIENILEVSTNTEE